MYICVVKLNCKKAISTYHDKHVFKHVFVTIESLTIITRHWTRVKNLLLYLEVVAFVYLSILINQGRREGGFRGVQEPPPPPVKFRLLQTHHLVWQDKMSEQYSVMAQHNN